MPRHRPRASYARARRCSGGWRQFRGPGRGVSGGTRASSVLLLIRGDDLNKNMSSYLVHRIEQTPNIELLCNTTIRRMNGKTHLGSWTSSTARPGRSGQSRRRVCSASSARTREPTGFPRKSSATTKALSGPERTWRVRLTGRPRRQPFPLETSRAGVFAAGDVRSGSVKRVASAVGEGAMAVQFVHERLKQM